MASKIPFTFRIYSGTDVEREEVVTVNVPGVIKIGKLESSHLRIDDVDVSKMHALIEISSPQEIHVLDLGSAKGTILNGESVKKAQLRDGAELLLGDTRVGVSIGQAEAESAATDASAAAPASQAAPPQPAAQPWSGLPRVGGAPAPGPAPMMPPGYGGSAPVGGYATASPGASAVAADPALDLHDGSHVVEVTAMFEDEVLQVRHLDNPAGGKVNSLTWGLLGAGWGTVAIGMIVAIAGQTGFGGLLLRRKTRRC